MLDLRLGGASYKAIAAAGLKEGLVPVHKCGPFEQAAAASKVELLLGNPFYMGRFEWNGDEYPGLCERQP